MSLRPARAVHLPRRAGLMPASPIRKLVPYADAARARGVHIYSLNIGQPDIETPAPMLEKLRACRDRVLAYSPSGGTPEYLATLVDYYAVRRASNASTSGHFGVLEVADGTAH